MAKKLTGAATAPPWLALFWSAVLGYRHHCRFAQRLGFSYRHAYAIDVGFKNTHQ